MSDKQSKKPADQKPSDETEQTFVDDKSTDPDAGDAGQQTVEFNDQSWGTLPVTPPQPQQDEAGSDSTGFDQTIELDSKGEIADQSPPRTGPTGTVIEPDPQDGIGQTVEFDPEESAGSLTLDSSTAEAQGDSQPTEPRGDQTVDDLGMKTHEMQTVDLGPPGSGNDYPTIQVDENVESGIQDSSDAFKATIDPDSSQLNGNNITQTLDARAMSESDQRIWGMTTDFDVEDKQKRPQPFVERDNITESQLMVPGRQLAGLNSDIQLDSDYELVEVLGEGGMGTVFLARQTSLDRLVALKMVKPLAGEKAEQLRTTGKLTKTEKNRRDQFLAEAIVTGDLDHPNIVPIHDLAVADNDSLFYAMKKVDGTPWSSVIMEKSQDENLEILLKVCDAMGFAHARGIVHRDIKPENVMLGEYGVVMLMDWGLAVPKPTYQKRGSINSTMSLGGSPAYMAPEMATGPIEDIGPASDIYLLGAVLFEIITGRPPHVGNNLTQCLRAAAVNKIVDVSSRHDGELMQIARKAMATKPSRRFASVSDLQHAIREYRSHAESILMTVRADSDMRKARQSGEYTDYARTTFGYEEALTLWAGNKVAQSGLQKSRFAYAETALNKEDFELGLSLLDASDEDHKPLVAKLREGQRERDSRRSRLAMARRIGVGLVLFILIGGSGALYTINKEKDRAVAAELEANTNARIADAERRKADASRIEAERSAEVARIERNRAKEQATIAKREKAEAEKQRGIAEDEKREAEKQRGIAVDKQREADEQRAVAVQQKMEADTQRDKAETNRMLAVANEQKAVRNAEEAQRQRKKAEYEAYVAQIGLAKARIDQNEFDDARRILTDLRKLDAEDQPPSWEWQWLWHQANQSQSVQRLGSAGRNLAIGASSGKAIVTLDDGSAHMVSIDSAGNMDVPSGDPIPTTGLVTATAISPNEQTYATAMADGTVRLWRSSDREALGVLRGHTGEITSISFVDEQRLISTSTDRTARLWDLNSNQQLAVCWHIAPVRDASVSVQGGQIRLLTAVADEHSGRAVVWALVDGADEIQFERVGDFLGHRAPVHAVALSANGLRAASGDRDGRILLWDAQTVTPIDYASRIDQAVRAVTDDVDLPTVKPQDQSEFIELLDSKDDSVVRLVSFESTNKVAHNDAIESIQFSDDGTRLLSTSDDYTIKLWQISSAKLLKTLRGHGGWVRDALFVPGQNEIILSAGNDSSVRSWRPSDYLDVVAIQSPLVGSRKSFAHDDEIWSASFDHTGSRIVTASRDHTARIIEIDRQTLSFKTSTELADAGRLDEGSQFVALSIAVDQSRDRIYVGSADSTVRVWNINTGSEVSQARGTGLNSTIAVAPNGAFLVTGSSNEDARVLVWTIDQEGVISSEPRFRLGEHQSTVTAIAVSHDSKQIYTGDRNGVGILWNSETGERIAESLNQHRGFRINEACFAPDRSELFVAADDQKLSRVDLKTLATNDLLPHQGFVTKVSLSSDGAWAATLTESSTGELLKTTITLWDLNTNQSVVIDQAEKSKKQGERIVSVRFSKDGRLIASHNRTDGSVVKIWDFGSDTPSLSKMLQMPSKLADLVDATAGKDQRLLSLNGDSAFLWDLTSLNHVRSYRAHGGVTEADFSADGRFVVTGSRSIKVWDVDTGKSIRKVEVPHDGAVRSVQFSPRDDAYLIASGGEDGVTRLWEWDAESSLMIERQALKTDSQTAGAIRQVRFSPSGKYLLAVSDDSVARVWTVGSDNPPIEFWDDSSEASYLCGDFSPDERWIVVGCSDRQARLWEFDPSAPKTTEPNVVLRGHADIIEDVGFLGSNANQIRVMTASRDKSARIWDPKINDQPVDSGPIEGREILSLRKHSLGLTAVDAIGSGSLLLTAGRDGSIVLWPAGLPDGPN